MIIFYSNEIRDDVAILNNEEARHCFKVLRKKTGDKIRFTDGLGWFYDSIITEIDKKECKLKIENRWEVAKRDYNLTIAISPVKNTSRFEWFLEKAVEIGVDRIIPISCKRTEKRNIKETRLNSIIISACKQSLKAKFPILNPMISFEEYIESITESETVYIAHLNDYSEYLGKVVKPIGNINIIIGPEGDFTEEELKFAFSRGVKPVSLGSSRLRTETAGVVSCQIVNTVNEINK